jgi:hypothetical protein
MAEVPFELRYQLSRRQRLVPHLRIWGVAYTPFVVLVFLFFCVQAAPTGLGWRTPQGAGRKRRRRLRKKRGHSSASPGM